MFVFAINTLDLREIVVKGNDSLILIKNFTDLDKFRISKLMNVI